MIHALLLHDVGPARHMDLTLGSRLNVITGDNGLGKSFILDVVWWLLTHKWPAGKSALPWRPREVLDLGDGPQGVVIEPHIRGILGNHDGLGASDGYLPVVGKFIPDSQDWVWVPMRTPVKELRADPQPASLSVYLRVDGSVAVFDPYQVRSSGPNTSDGITTLDRSELWDGKRAPDPGSRERIVCRGLIEDWVTWQTTRAPEFEFLRRALAFMSPEDTPLAPATPTRVRVDDRRDIPTLDMPYGTVPVTLAAAGYRRILTLAYALVWAWTEHRKTAQVVGRQPIQDMVVVIDEVELHLHPKWQRVLLPAILEAIGAFAPNVAIQLIATTHAPLVLASLESTFDPERDALHTLDMVGQARRVEVDRATWRRFGDVNKWLTSHVFDLELPRSLEAERTLVAATRLLDDPDLDLEEARRIHRELHGVLGDTDPFWTRWVALAESKGFEP